MGENMSTMKVNLKTTGMQNISKNLDGYLKNLTSAVFDACGEAAGKVRTYANNSLTPVDTGYMVNTSFDIGILIHGNPGAEIVYTAPYSMKVETNQFLAHGASFNIKHASEILLGLEHERKPTEQRLFLHQAVLDNHRQVFEIIKGAAVNVTV